MTLRNERFDPLWLIDIETREVTEIDRYLFLSTMRYVFSNQEGWLGQ